MWCIRVRLLLQERQVKMRSRMWTGAIAHPVRGSESAATKRQWLFRAAARAPMMSFLSTPERLDDKQKAPAEPGPALSETVDRSARIELDDQMRLHLDREGHVRQA